MSAAAVDETRTLHILVVQPSFAQLLATKGMTDVWVQWQCGHFLQTMYCSRQ
jgi:hypothetical protein